MVYPAVYDAQEVEALKIGPILYPGEIGKGAGFEHCIICLSDDVVAQEYINASNGDIIELTAAQVDAYMAERWEGRHNPEEAVTHSDRIQAIIAKTGAGIALSDEDRAALDPDNRMLGVNRRNKDHNIFFHRFKVDNEPIEAIKARMDLK